MTSRTYETSTGVTKRTSTQRRYIVVDRNDGAIIYRTDDIGRALARERQLGQRFEVIDTDL